MNYIDKAADKVKKHFLDKLDEAELGRIRRGAIYFLYFGPFSAEEMADNGVPNWPGYEKACEMLSEWANENVHDVWFNHIMDEIFEKEPEAEEDMDGEMIEPFWDDYIHFGVAWIKLLVFGELLTNGM